MVTVDFARVSQETSLLPKMGAVEFAVEFSTKFGSSETCVCREWLKWPFTLAFGGARLDAIFSLEVDCSFVPFWFRCLDLEALANAISFRRLTPGFDNASIK